MKKIDKYLRYLCKYSLWLGSLILSAIVMINVINILRRWILGAPFQWTLEISLILFVYSTLLCIPYLYKEKGLIQMRLIEEISGPQVEKYVDFFVDLSVSFFLIYLIPNSFRLSMNQLSTFSRGLGIPRTIVTIVVPIVGIFLLILSLTNLLQRMFFDVSDD